MVLKIKDEQIKQTTFELGQTSDTSKEVTFTFANGELIDVDVIQSSENVLESSKTNQTNNSSNEDENILKYSKTPPVTLLDKAVDYLRQKDENGITNFKRITEKSREMSLAKLRQAKKRMNQDVRNKLDQAWQELEAKRYEQEDETINNIENSKKNG